VAEVDGVLTVPRQDHGVVRSLLVFRDRLGAIGLALRLVGLLVALRGLSRTGLMVGCSGGRGRATAFSSKLNA